MTEDPARPDADTDPLFTVEAATLEDVEACCLIECEAARSYRDVGLAAAYELPGLPRAAIRQAISDRMLWMARWREPDMAVGFALTRYVDGQLHLHELDVLPGFQRRGVGRALVEHLLGWAHQEGLSRVTLLTFQDVPWNAPFYRGLGFETLAETERGPQFIRLVRHEHMTGLPGIAPRVALMFRL